jgi:hypothetical protein
LGHSVIFSNHQPFRFGLDELLVLVQRRSTIGDRETETETEAAAEMGSKPNEVLEPLEWGKLYGGENGDNGNNMDHNHHHGVSATQELLVSMCFFARLAVIQPPCCLECVYRERLNEKCCPGWVVWRKDATVLAHPDTLGPNIVMVPCWMAQRLTAAAAANGNNTGGKTTTTTSVGGWTWDAATKQFRRTAGAEP